MTDDEPRDLKSLPLALQLAIEEARVTRPAPVALKARIAHTLGSGPVMELQRLLKTMKGQSYFEVLGVARDADVNALKSSYLKAARSYHPDTVPPDAPPELTKVNADIFALIGEANRTLSDAKLREDYVAELAVGGPGAKVDVEKLFRAEERFQSGLRLVKAGKYLEALKVLDDAIADNPDEPEFYAWRGYARFLSAPDPKPVQSSVLRDLHHCTATNPRVAAAWHFLGLVAKALGDVEHAHQHFAHALECDPGIGEVVGQAPSPAERTDAASCPITDAFLPDNMKKHVDPKAPVPLRMMAAKALVPLQPPDMLSVLFMLTYDAEPSVREQALKTAASLPERIAVSGFRDEDVHPPVLGWFLMQYAQHEAYAELLLHNPSTPDGAVAAVASSCSQRTAEIIGQNQLRLLRTDAIMLALAQNPASAGALIDGVCDFAVRSGLMLDDVPQMKAAQLRLFGPEARPLGPTAEQVMAEFPAELGEGQSASLSKRIQSMSVAEKVKLAARGPREARELLLRDSNRLVAVAVISNPRITDGEVLAQAQNKLCNEDVLRIIYGKREWLRSYAIKLALVKNPRVPQGVSMRLLATLHEHDLKSLARDKSVPVGVQSLARKHSEKIGGKLDGSS